MTPYETKRQEIAEQLVKLLKDETDVFFKAKGLYPVAEAMLDKMNEAFLKGIKVGREHNGFTPDELLTIEKNEGLLA